MAMRSAKTSTKVDGSLPDGLIYGPSILNLLFKSIKHDNEQLQVFYFNSILNTEPCLEMVSSHSPSTSEATIDNKVGPVSTHSDVEIAPLPGVLEVERLTKSVMYISQALSKGKKYG
jgi:hypothetical protein